MLSRTSALFVLSWLALAGCSSKSSDGTGGAGGATTTTTTSSTGSGACNQTVCGDACVDLQSDPANCGACGYACTTGDLCCGGACNATASCALSVSSIESKLMGAGWQSGGDYVLLHGAGFAPGMRVFFGDGRGAVKVLDGQTARVKTPPGPLGPVDVRVEVAGTKATMKLGFTYKSAGLMTPWEQKPMQTVRGEDPGLAVLQDGRVLVAGGTTVPDDNTLALDTAEIYTRETDVVTPAANTMSSRRWHSSAVTLLDGRVLVVGTACIDGSCGDPQSADLFDPATDKFTPTANKLNVGRIYTRSTLLPDGRVLISSMNDPSLEIFDPDTQTFTLVPHTGTHVFGFMVLLRDGRALFGAGDGGNTSVEIFDPDTNQISATGSLAQGRSMLTAHTLPDGRVLVIGGSSLSAGGIQDPLSSVEIYDAKTGMWTTATYKLSIGRTWHASALVRDGTILVMGGYTVPGSCASLVDTVDQIDPVAGVVTPFPTLPNANTEWTAVTLLDGSVLGVGGGACGTSSALPDIDFLPGAPAVN